jgi:plastocyanin
MKKFGTFLAAVALVAALATACGSNSSENSSETAGTASDSSVEKSPTGVASGPTITIANMAFGQPLTVAPGSKVNLANNDTMEHSVTSDTAGAFDQDVEGNEEATMTAPSQPGEYPFHCSYHPNMKGTLIVK